MGSRREAPVGANGTETSSRRPSRLPVLLVAIGLLFYWIGLPPLKQPWGGYIASFFLCAAVYIPFPSGRRTWLGIYLVSALFWLALLQGIRLAYWPLWGGWIALSLYVAVYVPLFVATAKRLRTQTMFPLPIACAVSWCGWELIRSYFATGFSACMLAHTQTPWPPLLNIASHLGMFGVSFFVMLAGASVFYASIPFWESKFGSLPERTRRERIGFRCGNVLVGVWLAHSIAIYNRYEEKLQEMAPIKPLGGFLLVQHNMPTMFESDPEGLRISWAEYARETRKGIQTYGADKVEVVVWPESTFEDGFQIPWWFDWDQHSELGSEWGIQAGELRSYVEEHLAKKWSRLTPDAPFPISYLVGGGVMQLKDGKVRRYNAALWLTPDPSRKELPIVQFYGKRHLVMFGEYIPIVSDFPDLLAKFGMGALDSGERFEAWKTRSGMVIAPAICFENVVPQLIQRQLQELEKEGKTPDLLVTITNDGWFRGSSLLDHHLNNAIGCAVENRRPMLVAANSGISAWIDSTGRVVKSLGRFETGTIFAEPIPDARWGLWQSIGDWPARIAAILALLPWFMAIAGRMKRKITDKPDAQV